MSPRRRNIHRMIFRHRFHTSTPCIKPKPGCSRRSQSAPDLPGVGVGWNIKFIVGEKKKVFLVNPLLLVVVSDVFRVLLKPSWYSSVIKIPDVDPEAFELFRQFLYSPMYERNKLEIRDHEHFLNSYYLAHKYNIRQFLAYLEDSIGSVTDADNVLGILVHADLYQSTSLKSYCWSYIEKHTNRVVKSDSFPYLPWEQFCGLLENNRLTIGEYDLFQGIMRWCRLQGGQHPDKKIYDIIGVAVYKIRYPLMTRQEFQSVIHSGILKMGEIEDLLSNFHRNQSFNTRRRKNICQCRSQKMACVLCTICPDFTDKTKPLDGRVNICCNLPQLCKLLFLFDYYEAFHQGILSTCECAKYNSCPAFPNGATNILREIILAQRRS